MPFTDRDAKRRYDAARYAANADAVRARVEANRRRDPAAHQHRTAAWYAAHPLERRAHGFTSQSNRRARRWNPDAARLCMADACAVLGPCAYCGTDLPMGGWDHVMPLCLGGANTIDNLLPSCLACNHRKARRAPTCHELALLRAFHMVRAPAR